MGVTDWPILSLAIRNEADVVSARQRARRVAELLGFDTQDQTRIATAVSEIARNAFEYAGGGRASFSLLAAETAGPAGSQRLAATITDRGPGIAQLDAVLDGRYRSRTGLGIGLLGAKRLMDGLHVETGPSGTTVSMEKLMPRRRAPLARDELGILANRIAAELPIDPLAVLAAQNRELVASLDELKTRGEELARLNGELEDTNRGVVALYAELDTRAEQLREASEAKTRFLSNMSHEFRTPLHSILALSQLLLDRSDGELTDEQELQVGFVRKGAQSLSDLVNDLLDLAKVEAGKIDVRPSSFTVAGLFGALRGSLKPLKTNPLVDLSFVEPDAGLPELSTDEAKVAQILRNFVSNALKFTAEGGVCVAADFERKAGRILFSVSDTGVGIAPADQKRVFEEFEQVEGPLQRTTVGTGLGLPLSRRLAELLGGEILLESIPGRGSRFTLAVPPIYNGSVEARRSRSLTVVDDRLSARVPRLLLVDDEEAFRYLVKQMVKTSKGPEGVAFDVIEAADGVEGLQLARAEPQPDIILLDLQMPRLDGFDMLQALAADPGSRDIPVVVATASELSASILDRLSHARAVIPKDSFAPRDLIAALGDLGSAKADKASA